VTRRKRKTQLERTAESTQRLLDAAIELFATQGYENTTTEQIAERAGYSRAMVNARYGSKEGLLETMLAAEWENLLLRAVASPTTGLQRIMTVIDTLHHLVKYQPTHLRAFMIVSFEATGPITELRPHIAERLRHIEGAFSEAMAAGVRDRSIRPDVDPDFEARELIHSGIGATYRWIIDANGFDFGGYLDQWRDTVRRRLTPPR
jgi:AcrR family transcriptional regulator